MRPLSHNAFYRSDGPYADEQGTSSAWVFTAQHTGTNDSVEPSETVRDATALVRIGLRQLAQPMEFRKTAPQGTASAILRRNRGPCPLIGPRKPPTETF